MALMWGFSRPRVTTPKQLSGRDLLTGGHFSLAPVV